MKKIEYCINEAFQVDGKTYMCVETEGGPTYCSLCSFPRQESNCLQLECSCYYREDGKSVLYREITKPAVGLLYHSEDGTLYRFQCGVPDSNDCACTTDISCEDISLRLFDYYVSNWHWVPVEKPAPTQEKTKKRHIRLVVVNDENEVVTFKIMEQTHRCEQFSQQSNSCCFEASNGITLVSGDISAWCSSKATLYCCCVSRVQDNADLVCTKDAFEKIHAAVTEYNETDGMGYKKPWPRSGDRYFYITMSGNVECLVFLDTDFDNDMRIFGNFFRTKGAAEAALVRVKQALKKKEE